ncbi:hypothetical protein [Bradyrhizobium sp. SZCCHNRI1003]|uniref:hypothetical protein n=1 Tax=Bradyrhizobium sp. SZCCHNRI1003 TaxID=3057275 RepID=UPI002915CB91|nr:hypothetical protein [Bradyrhizobium sp. SZCCHNRI1003]
MNLVIYFVALLALACQADARPISRISNSVEITKAHCDGDLVVVGGLHSIKLPPAMGWDDGCDIWIRNGDAHAGKKLIDFPTDANSKLYPKQVINITTFGGTWITKYIPGRYMLPNTTEIFVSGGPLGDDANDGLSDLTPLQHINTAGRVIQSDFDLRQGSPIIAVDCGYTYNEQLSLGGAPVGGNLIQLSPNCKSGRFTWRFTPEPGQPGPCINFGDGAMLDLRLNYYGELSGIDMYCNPYNIAGTGAIAGHNTPVLDIEGGKGSLVVHGAGDNDHAIWFDGPGIGTVQGLVVAGTFDSAIGLGAGGKLTNSPPVGCTGAECYSVDILGAPTLNAIWRLQGGSNILLGGPAAPGGYASLGASAIVEGHSRLNVFGLTMPTLPPAITNDDGRVCVKQC